MPKIDDELGLLERDIRQLKIEYEQYFGGGRPRPPADTEWRVEQAIKRYSERNADMSYAQRFRFSNLAATYAKYREVWRKRLKLKEEGTVPRHFGAAAKAIEAERARATGQREPPAPRRRRRKRQAAVPVLTLACEDPDREQEKVERLYKALVAVQQSAGESPDCASLEDFRRFVRAKTQQLRERGSGEIEYAVTVEDGKVRLKARVKAPRPATNA